MSTPYHYHNGDSAPNRTTLNVHEPQLDAGPHMFSTAGYAPYSITPASTPSRNSFSTTSSPIISAMKAGPTSPELRDDPIFYKLDMPQGLAPLALPASPPASAPTSPPPKAMSEATVTVSRGGLMRRLSRGAMGAHNKLRGRPSASVLQSRDQRGGSVVRRRSDSRSIIDGSYDVSEMELDPEDEEIISNRMENIMSSARDKPQMPSRRSSDRAAAPVPIPGPTNFVKLTKRNRKIIRLAIPTEKNKITWSTSSDDTKKLDVRNQIYVDDMKDIREGKDAALCLGEIEILDHCVPMLITIIYQVDQKRKMLHLLATTTQERQVWIEALRDIWQDREDVMLGMVESDERTLREYWRRAMAVKYAADSSSDETLDFDTIKKTCVAYHINKPEKHLRRIFDDVDTDGRGSLNLKQYLEFFRQLTESRNVKGVFDHATRLSDGYLTHGAFMRFLKEEQRLDIDSRWNHLERVFNDRADLPADETRPEKAMSFQAFRSFLDSEHNSALVKEPKLALNRPISDYFISTSHNTYLLGRQINGESSVEGYIQALMRGCRCIEIDCWDGEGGKPIVTHGRTLSSHVTFSDCIKAVNEYAFRRSEYPLIISLEVHCNGNQQAAMAQIMKQHFGSRLLLEPLPTHRTMLPSPEELKGRILIKVKRAMHDDTSTMQKPVVHRRMRSASAPNPHTNVTNLGVLSNLPTPPATVPTIPLTPVPVHAATFGFVEATTTEHTTSDDSDSEVEEDVASSKKRPATSKIVTVLGEMGVYTRGATFSDWKSKDSKLFSHIYSFNEKTFEKRSKTPELKASLQRHNAHYLMRVYPHGSRFRSDNFDPIQFWRRGVQMVATNWQTRDLGTEINDAMFASDADRRGYVAKPADLDHFKHAPSIPKAIKLPKKKVRFSVRIIAGQHLGKDTGHAPQNPYVEFEMYSAEDKGRGIAIGTGGTDDSNKNGLSGIGHPLRKRTEIVTGNGYDPLWDQTIDMELTTKYPGLVFVRWTVRHSSNGRNANGKEIVGAFTAKLSSLAQGYRYIPLYNKNGDALVSRLFCYIRREEHVEVTESLEDDLPNFTTRTSEDSGLRKRDRMFGLFRTVSGRRSKIDVMATPQSPLHTSTIK